MNLQDAVRLINHPVITAQPDALWADLGCGSGLFTFALAHQLQPGGSIYAVDKQNIKLQPLPNPHGIAIEKLQADFTTAVLPLPPLDGILMANALHFVADKPPFISLLAGRLKKDGAFLLVEYNTDKPNTWVPYPVSRKQLQLLFANAGYSSFAELGKMPSAYSNGELYAAFIQKTIQ